MVLIRKTSWEVWRRPFPSFRPLAGIMVLIIDGLVYIACLIGVSVPLRGLWFLSLRVKRTYGEKLIEFPSPCGDYGSYLEKF